MDTTMTKEEALKYVQEHKPDCAQNADGIMKCKISEKYAQAQAILKPLVKVEFEVTSETKQS